MYGVEDRIRLTSKESKKEALAEIDAGICGAACKRIFKLVGGCLGGGFYTLYNSTPLNV